MTDPMTDPTFIAKRAELTAEQTSGGGPKSSKALKIGRELCAIFGKLQGLS